MARARAIVTKEGRVEVHIELPPGEQCNEADALLQATLALLGAPLHVDRRRRAAQPDGVPVRERATVGRKR